MVVLAALLHRDGPPESLLQPLLALDLGLTMLVGFCGLCP